MFKVVITQRVDSLESRHETRDALDQHLCEWVLASGGLPFPVPNVLDEASLLPYLHQINPDAVRIMKSLGYGDITKVQRPKLLQELPEIDIVITIINIPHSAAKP